jgi:hypothetical protein
MFAVQVEDDKGTRGWLLGFGGEMGLAGWIKTDRCSSFFSDLALLLIATGFSGKERSGERERYKKISNILKTGFFSHEDLQMFANIAVLVLFPNKKKRGGFL